MQRSPLVWSWCVLLAWCCHFVGLFACLLVCLFVCLIISAFSGNSLHESRGNSFSHALPVCCGESDSDDLDKPLQYRENGDRWAIFKWSLSGIALGMPPVPGIAIERREGKNAAITKYAFSTTFENVADFVRLTYCSTMCDSTQRIHFKNGCGSSLLTPKRCSFGTI